MVSNIPVTKEMRGSKLNFQFFIGFENLGFLVFGVPVGLKVVIFKGFGAQLRKRKYLKWCEALSSSFWVLGCPTG